MVEPLRVAIAGCHRMLDRTPANHNWAAAFAAVPTARMVAVYDKGAETRRAFVDCWGPLPSYDDYGRMLQDIRPDIVCVATRQTVHADQIDAAAESGVRGILCDKPLATSMAEVTRIVAACEDYGVRFAFGVDRRWYAYYRALGRLLRDGAIGEVRSIVAYGLVNLINHGCHWYDRVLDLAGDPEVAWVSGWVDPLDGEPADSRRLLDPPGRVDIRFTNGVAATVSSSGFVKGFDLGFDVVGSHGRIAVLSDGAHTALWTVAESGKTPVPVELPPVPHVPHWPLIVEDLIDAVRGGHPTAGDVHHARRATTIGFAAHQSHRLGGVRVTPREVDPTLRLPSFPWGND